MGKTKRNSNYNNFVDTDKNNLIVIKPRKIVEQVRTFEGEEGFVVPKNNTYIDKGLIVNINDHDETAIDVVGVSDSLYENAGGSITLNGNVTTSANGAYVQISGGQTPYQSVTYTFGSGTGQQQGSPNSSSFGVNANYNQANSCYQGGAYTLLVNVTDANGDTGTYNWSGTIQGTCTTPTSGSGSGVSVQGNVGTPISTATPSGGSGVNVQGNVGTTTATATPSGGSGVNVQGNVGTPISTATATPTPTPIPITTQVTPTSPIATYSTSNLSGLNVNAVLVGANDIQVNVSYNGGIPSYSIIYVTYKDGNIINTSTQSSASNNDIFNVTGLADGNYTFKVAVTDSNNASISTISNMVNITTTPSVLGTASTGTTGLTPPSGATTPTTGGTPSTGQAGQTGGSTTTPTPTTTTPTGTTPTPTTSTNAPILGSGGFSVIEKPIYLERETIIEAETFYSKNKFPIWLLIAIGVYFIATNKKN